MTEAEKIKVQIETLEGAKQIVRNGVDEPGVEYPFELRRYVERRVDYQVAMLRFTLKQLSRQATAANPLGDSLQGKPQPSDAAPA